HYSLTTHYCLDTLSIVLLDTIVLLYTYYCLFHTLTIVFLQTYYSLPTHLLRLVTCFNRRHHITPILASFHWFHFRFGIEFKILLITFEALLGLGLSYITEMLTPYEPVRSLRSLGGTLLAVPKSRLKSKGDHAFAIRALLLWNDLSEEIRLADSVSSFKSLFKTHFYRLAFM
ncbi:hypothetical protein LDENG_00244710, partial [Lucifuga dentata]